MKSKGFPHVATQTHQGFSPYYFKFEKNIKIKENNKKGIRG